MQVIPCSPVKVKRQHLPRIIILRCILRQRNSLLCRPWFGCVGPRVAPTRLPEEAVPRGERRRFPTRLFPPQPQQSRMVRLLPSPQFTLTPCVLLSPPFRRSVLPMAERKRSVRALKQSRMPRRNPRQRPSETFLQVFESYGRESMSPG